MGTVYGTGKGAMVSKQVQGRVPWLLSMYDKERQGAINILKIKYLTEGILLYLAISLEIFGK